MADNIDKRVVKFEFDNSKFEKNVKKSINSLDTLKESLDFKDCSKSLEEVRVKFSAFEVAAVTAVSNITNRVVDLGIRLVKSLSVDNISAGWTKFGEKTTAVATLMSQSLKVAGKEITDYATKMDVVNEQLDKLNWFTDETSYNFTDMVDNIGKFTAAGQSLDTSVEAMMGIANWAALSGQNASTASRAMYQLSQALGKGYVQLIDYKSIQNANMDTQEFRKTVLETAVAMGELTKQGETYITKTGSKFTQNQFTEQLSSKWFTSDVLTKSLNKYSEAVDELYKITEEEGITASEAIEKYSDKFSEFSIKAFKAAQEARTFADALNSVKDAVSTGWMNTAEAIFGSYDEAKVLWTDLANELYDVFAESGNFRNEVLSIWKDLEGRGSLFAHGDDNQGAFWNIYDSVVAVKNLVADAWNTIFPSSVFSSASEAAQDIAERLLQYTNALQQATAKVKAFITDNQKLKNIFAGIFSVVRLGVTAIQALRYSVDPLITLFKRLTSVILDFASKVGIKLTQTEKVTEGLVQIATKINEILSDVVELIDPETILNSAFNAIKNIFNVVSKLFNGIVDGFASINGPLQNGVSITEILIKVVNTLQNIILKVNDFIGDNIANALGIALTYVGQAIGKLAGYIINFGKILYNGVIRVKEFVSSNETMSKIFSKVKNTISGFTTVLKTYVSTIKEFFTVKNKDKGNSLLPISNNSNKETKKEVEQAENSYSLIENLTEIFKGLKSLILSLRNVIISLTGLLGGVLQFAANILNAVASLIKDIAEGLKNLNIDLKKLLKALAIIGIIIIIGKLIFGLIDVIAMFTTNFASLLEDLSYTLELKAKAGLLNAAAEVLKSFGLALIALAVSFAIFGELDTDAISKGILIMAVLGVLFVALQKTANTVTSSVTSVFDPSKGIFGKLQSLDKKTTMQEMTQLIGVINAFALAMVAIAYSLKTISKIDPESLPAAISILVGMAIFTLILSKTINKINKAKKGRPPKSQKDSSLFKLAMQLLFISAAIKLIQKSLPIIQSFGVGKFIILIGVMAGIALAYDGISRSIAKIGKKDKIDKNAVKSTKDTIKTIGKLVSSLALFAIVLNEINKINVSTSTYIVLGVFAGLLIAISVMSAIINKNSKNKEVKKAPKNAKDFAKSILQISLTLLSFTGALLVFGVALSVISSLKINEMSNQVWALIGGLSLVFAGLIILTEILNKNQSSSSKGGKNSGLISLAVNMVALSAALIVLSYALKVLSGVDWASILKGIAVISGIMGVMVLLGFIVGKVPAISAGLNIFATAMLKAGAGMMLMSLSIVVLMYAIQMLLDTLVYAASLSQETIEQGINNILLAIVGVGASITAVLVTIIAAVCVAIIQSLPYIVEAFVALIVALCAAIKETIPVLLDTLGFIITSVLQFIEDNIYTWTVQLVNIIVNFVLGIIYGVADRLQEIVNAILYFFDKLFEAIFGNETWMKIQKKASELWEKFKKWLSTTWTNLKITVKNAAVNIWDGIKEGLLAGWNRVKGWIEETFSGIGNFFKDIFAISSPSKVFAQYGDYLMQGLANGVEDNSYKAEDSMVDSMSNAISAIGDTINGEISDDGLTITPVLDLSSVRDGANDISSMMSGINSGLSVSGQFASSASNEINRNKKTSENQNGVSTTTNNSNDVYNTTFNITTDDPEELARETDKILQRNRQNALLAKGG